MDQTTWVEFVINPTFFPPLCFPSFGGDIDNNEYGAQAASFGGTNIDPMAWEDKKCPGESRFPAQVSISSHIPVVLSMKSICLWFGLGRTF